MSKTTLELLNDIEREEEQQAFEQKRKDELAQQRLAELNQQKRDFDMINAEMRGARVKALAKLWPILIPALVEVGVLGYRQTYMDKQDRKIDDIEEQRGWEQQDYRDIINDPEATEELKRDAKEWHSYRLKELRDEEKSLKSNKEYYDILTQIGVALFAIVSAVLAGLNYDAAVWKFRRSEAKKIQAVLATIRRGGLSRSAASQLYELGNIGANIFRKYSREYPEIVESLLKYESNPDRTKDGTDSVYRWAATAIVRGALERNPMLMDEVMEKFNNILELPVNLVDVVNMESEENEVKERVIDKFKNARKLRLCRVVLESLYHKYRNTDFAEALRKTHALSDGIEGQKMDLENMQEVAQKFVYSRHDAQAIVLDALMEECIDYSDFEMGVSMFFEAKPETLRRIWKEQHDNLYSNKWGGPIWNR